MLQMHTLMDLQILSVKFVLITVFTHGAVPLDVDHCPIENAAGTAGEPAVHCAGRGGGLRQRPGVWRRCARAAHGTARRRARVPDPVRGLVLSHHVPGSDEAPFTWQAFK